jgi:hypothetical protein
VETATKKGNVKGLLSATSVIVALLVIVIAANGVIWKNRLARSAEITSLETDLGQVNRNIARVPAPPDNLDVKMTAAAAALSAAQTALPPEFNRNDAVDYILKLAEECQVQAMPISSQGWAVEKTGQPYATLKLNTTVNGAFSRVNDFIYRLQHGKYPTLAVPEIDMTRSSDPDLTGAFSGDNTEVSVRLNITIYARLSAADAGNKQ